MPNKKRPGVSRRENRSDEERLLAKETKAVLEHKKLAAEIAKLRREQVNVAYQNSWRGRYLSSVITASASIAAIAITAVITALIAYKLTYKIQNDQRNDALRAQEITKFNDAFEEATDSTKGEARRAAGVYALAEYWSTQPPPSDLQPAAADERTMIVKTEQSRIASALTAVLVADDAHLDERFQAAWAISKAFPDQPQPKGLPSSHDLASLLFGNARENQFGTVTFANSYLRSRWKYYRFTHKNPTQRGFDRFYLDKIAATDLTFQLCRKHLTNGMFSGCDLSHAQLKFANLTYCDLSYANLAHANLIHAYLKDSAVDEAIFSGSDISHAIVKGIKGRPRDISLALLTKAANKPS